MSELESSINEYVTFLIADEAFAINMAPVQEIVRVPEVVKVPKSPPSLMGLANLRGKVLPIINLRKVFGLKDIELDESSRAIVIDICQPMGFVVDKVLSVINVEGSKIERTTDIGSIVSSEYIDGVMKEVTGLSIVMVLNIKRLIETEFKGDTQVFARQELTSKIDSMQEDEAFTEDRQFVSFAVNKEEYAIAIEDVQEIVQLPEHITQVPNTKDFVVGIMNLRDKTLPLASLRRLFSMPDAELTEQCRIVVLTMGSNSIGIIVDEVREVLSVHESVIEPVPKVLFGDEQADSEISGICRLNNSKRLVSIISVDRLFRHKHLEEAIDKMQDSKEQVELQEADDDEEQVVVFRLNSQDYAVSINDVQEIVRVPEELTRVPKTPSFVEGVINLRGKVLPVIDLNRRFELPEKARDDHQRIMVFALDGVNVGFIVDAVSEVLKIPKSAISGAPGLSAEQARIFSKVANLQKEKRIIQIIEPQELLGVHELGELQSSM